MSDNNYFSQAPPGHFTDTTTPNGNFVTSTMMDGLQSTIPGGGGDQSNSTTNSEPLPYLEQHGRVILGPGSKKDALLLGLGLPKLSRRQEDDLINAKSFAMEQSIKHVLLKQSAAMQQQQKKMTQYGQALSLMGRLYVGSISFEMREEMIRNAFAPFGPLRQVNMTYDPVTGHHKGFAFLEFEVAEAAQLAQEQMNGVLMGGRNIKVGRPSNMMQAQNIVEMIKEDAKAHHRIYVSSIHPDLSETDVQSVFEAFGPIVSIEFAKGPPPDSKHRGYCYIDYETEQSAVDAIASMNLFDLGGQFLRVGRAITPPAFRNCAAGTVPSLPTASAVAAAAVTAKLQLLEAANAMPSPPAIQPQIFVNTSVVSPSTSVTGGQTFAIPPPAVVPIFPTPSSGSPSNVFGNNSPAFPTEFQPPPPIAAVVAEERPANHPSNIGGTAPMDLTSFGQSASSFGQQNGASRNESRVIVLKNMVGPAEVDETLEGEVGDECSNFGRVEHVFVFHDETAQSVQIKIFVKFSAKHEAANARSNLDGRYFNGRQIEATFYDENLFDRNDFTR